MQAIIKIVVSNAKKEKTRIDFVHIRNTFNLSIATYTFGVQRRTVLSLEEEASKCPVEEKSKLVTGAW